VLTHGAPVTVEADIANDGQVVGEETAFLFIRDPVASVGRPVLELKGTEKITLAPGATGTVRFTLGCDDVCFADEAGRPVLEAGALEVYVGPCADRARLLKAALTVQV
jgi:beta-glucosidase